MEVWEENEFNSWESFLAHSRDVQIAETVNERCTREIVVRSHNAEMNMRYDPLRENILSRTWCGAEDRTTHMVVSAAGNPKGPFSPQTLYGSEGRGR
jgi:hypothetical protein